MGGPSYSPQSTTTTSTSQGLSAAQTAAQADLAAQMYKSSENLAAKAVDSAGQQLALQNKANADNTNAMRQMAADCNQALNEKDKRNNEAMSIRSAESARKDDTIRSMTGTMSRMLQTQMDYMYREKTLELSKWEWSNPRAST